MVSPLACQISPPADTYSELLSINETSHTPQNRVRDTISHGTPNTINSVRQISHAPTNILVHAEVFCNVLQKPLFSVGAWNSVSIHDDSCYGTLSSIYIAIDVTNRSNIHTQWNPVSGEDFGAYSVNILVFPSPTGYTYCDRSVFLYKLDIYSTDSSRMMCKFPLVFPLQTRRIFHRFL